MSVYPKPIAMSLQVQIGEHFLPQDQILPLLVQYQLMPQLAKEVILDQAIAALPEPIQCNEEETKAAITQFIQQRQIRSEAELHQWLQINGLKPEQLAAIAARPLIIEKFKQQRWGENLEPYFVERKSALDKIIYSLIRTDDPGIAQELYFRILDEPNAFPELAKQYSQGAESQTGGLVGPVEIGTPHPQMQQILAIAAPGEIKPPVKIGEWFVLLRLEQKIPAQLDETMRQRLIHEQFEQWLKQQLSEQISFHHGETGTPAPQDS